MTYVVYFKYYMQIRYVENFFNANIFNIRSKTFYICINRNNFYHLKQLIWSKNDAIHFSSILNFSKIELTQS